MPFAARKPLVLVLLAALTLALGGCVYLRLLELKKQLAHFDDNFKAQTDDGIAIQCLHPILEGDDLRWLGAEPKAITSTEAGEDWIIRWVKEPPPGANETTIYDVEIGASLVDDQLVEIRIPERFFAYFSKELFLNVLRSTGTAKVDRSEHSAAGHTEASADAPMPGIQTITSMLGQPTRQRQDGKMIFYVYRYRADTTTPAVKPIEVTFAFDPASGLLQRLTSQLPHGKLNFDFSKPAPVVSPGQTSKTDTR